MAIRAADAGARGGEGRLEVDATPGFFPIAVASGFGTLGAAEFFWFFRRFGWLRLVGGYGWPRGQRRLLIILVHDNSLWIEGWRWSTLLAPSAAGTVGIRVRTLAAGRLFQSIFCRVIMPVAALERNEPVMWKRSRHLRGPVCRHRKDNGIPSP